MSQSFKIGDFSIHKIVEEERPFYDIKTYFPSLTDEVLAANRDWLQACGAIDAQGQIVLCMQCYLVRTPRHTILVDSCIGNDKNLPHRPQWHRMNRPNFHNALAAAGVTVAGWNGSGASANQLSVPYGVAVDGAGNVFVAAPGIEAGSNPLESAPELHGVINVLLLGGDAGKNRWGLRPDSISVANINLDTVYFKNNSVTRIN